MQSYKTIKTKASDFFLEHKSRFIGYACPVNNEEDALAFINEIRKKHKDARHNCYAYIIGENSSTMRFSDDGEPSGTAGIPIIEVLKVQKLVNIVVVVTRYFGGILLGAGGLIRAYRHACSIAVKAAQPVVMHPTQKWLFEVEYPLWDKLQYNLQHMPVIVEDVQYSATVNFTLLIKEIDSDSFLKQLTSLTDAKIESMLEETIFYAWSENVNNDIDIK